MASFLLLSPATMLPNNPTDQAIKAEIGFEVFPCGPCAAEADSLFRSLEGVIQIIFDPAVRRIAVLFDLRKVNIPLILSTLEPFGLKPRVISVISPMKGVSDVEDQRTPDRHQ